VNRGEGEDSTWKDDLAIDKESSSPPRKQKKRRTDQMPKNTEKTKGRHGVWL